MSNVTTSLKSLRGLTMLEKNFRTTDIYRIAGQFRCAIVRAKRNGEFNFRDRMYNFPSGCCDDACDLLAYYLQREYGITSCQGNGIYRDEDADNTTNHAWSERTKIQKEIVNNVMEKNSKFTMPSGLVASKVVVGSNPPMLPNSTTPSSKIQTHLFKKGTQPTKVYPVYNKPKEEKKDEDVKMPDILEP